MIFTGSNLVVLYCALDLAKAELHNQIATCPDVHQFEEDIKECELWLDKITKLRQRIAKKLPPEITTESPP